MRPHALSALVAAIAVACWVPATTLAAGPDLGALIDAVPPVVPSAPAPAGRRAATAGS